MVHWVSTTTSAAFFSGVWDLAVETRGIRLFARPKFPTNVFSNDKKTITVMIPGYFVRRHARTNVAFVSRALCTMLVVQDFPFLVHIGRIAFGVSTKKQPFTGVKGCLKCPAMTYFHAVRHYHRPHELNGRVRNGNVCFLMRMVTGLCFLFRPFGQVSRRGLSAETGFTKRFAIRD